MVGRFVIMNPGKPRRRLAGKASRGSRRVSLVRSPKKRRAKTKDKKMVRRRRRKAAVRHNPRRKRRVLAARSNPVRRRKRARRNPAMGPVFKPQFAGLDATTYVKKRKKKQRAARKRWKKATSVKRKSPKRVKAARKAARTRARNMAKAHVRRKSGSRKVRRSRRRSGGARSMRAIAMRMAKISSQIRSSRKRRKKKGGRRTFAARVLRTRYSALGLKRKAHRMRGKARRRALNSLRKHGLARVNFSFGGLVTAVKAAGPQMVTGAVSLVALAMAGKYLMPHVQKALSSVKLPAVVQKYMAPGVVGLLSVVAYGALLMQRNEKLRKAAMPVLMGGVGATTWLAYEAAGKGSVLSMTGSTSTGEYVGMSGAGLDVNGAMLRLNGMGDYVNMGEYVGMSGGIFGSNKTGSLGALPAPIDPQLNEGREDMRGTEGEPRVLEMVDGGSLSGDIFN